MDTSEHNSNHLPNVEWNSLSQEEKSNREQTILETLLTVLSEAEKTLYITEAVQRVSERLNVSLFQATLGIVLGRKNGVVILNEDNYQLTLAP
jgi:hypothetical protein